MWAGVRLIAFDITIKDYLHQIDEAPLLTAEEERYLGRLVRDENDPLAREQLVRSNLRLVVNIAKKYAGRGMGISDLVEEGNLGLIKAVDYYDPERGTRFSTYAAWWIKQSIKRALLTNVQPVHIPTYMMSLINQWRHMSAELQSKLGREPEVGEMADAMNLPMKKAKSIYDIVKVLSCVHDSSGDQEDEDEDGPVLERMLEDESAGLPENWLEQEEEKQKMLRVLNRIESREANILRWHYGLDGGKALSLREVAQKLDLTRERVRQLQKGALVKLFDIMNEEY